MKEYKIWVMSKETNWELLKVEAENLNEAFQLAEDGEGEVEDSNCVYREIIDSYEEGTEKRQGDKE